jgi:REP element-mobilizing transposase RayT
LSRPPRLEFDGAVYHVIARGNERRAIFRDDHDRQKYLDRLGVYSGRFRFDVYAYCLMPNHVHLAIRTGRVPLSRIMLALHGAYSQDFNRRHSRVGHLFQGRYKAFLVEAEDHLTCLVRYIHRNPVKARLVVSPDEFDWSSDRAYRRGGGPFWLDSSVAMSRFGRYRREAVKGYESYMAGDVGIRYEDLETHGRLIKGDEEFAVKMVRHAEESLVRCSLTVDRLGRLAAQTFGLTPDGFRAASTRTRGMTAYVGREVARIPLCRTADLFSKHETTIVKDVRRIEAQLDKDHLLRSDIVRLQRALADSGNQR